MESDIKFLEKFILSTDRTEAIKEIPDSCAYKPYLRYLIDIRTSNVLSKIDEDPRLDPKFKSKLRLFQQILNLEKNESLDETLQSLIKDLKLKFSHDPPQELLSTITSQYPSILDQSLLEENLLRLYTDKNAFAQSLPYSRKKLNVLLINDQVFEEYLKSPSEVLQHENVIERIAAFFKESKNIKGELLKLMRLDQLEKLEEIIPNIVFSIDFIQAKFGLKYNFSLNKDPKELYFVLNQFYQDAKNTKNQGLISVSLQNLLSEGPKLGVFDESILFEYFLYNRDSSVYSSPGLSSKVLDPFKSFLLGIPDELTLLSLYFERIFSNKSDCDQYLPYFKPKEFQKIYAKARIFAGADFSEFSEIFSHEMLKTIENLVILDPVQYNPSSFSKDEPAVIEFAVKNIKKLSVKLIEINTKSFYLQNNCEVSSDIDLEGLIVNEEYFYEFSDPPLVKTLKKFEFPSLIGKNGIFVLEFIGNGLHSRVIIKKGGLRYVTKLTIAGHLITILDENNKVCEKGGIYVDSKYYPLTSKFHAIIPFAQLPAFKNIIITDTEIYELVTNFQHLTENSSIKCTYFIHEEQFVFGKIAEMLISPKVYVNDIEYPESFIENIKAVVSTTDIENLTSTKSFGNLKFSNEMIKLDINVPPRIISLNVEVVVEVKINDQIKEFKHGYKTNFNALLKGPGLYCAHLRHHQEKGYFIEIKGRNGEKIKNFEGNFEFITKYSNNKVSQKLASNENGEIILGKLKGVRNFQGNFQDFSIKYYLNALKPHISYPSHLILCENDQFQLPVYVKHSKPTSSLFKLIQQKSNKNYRDYSNQLEYLHEENILNIKSLEKGDYILKLNKFNKDITITVVDGVHWGKNEFILTDSSVFPTSGHYNSFAIAPVSESPEKITVKLVGEHKLSHIYALYFNYASNLLKTYPQSILKNSEKNNSQVLNFTNPQNLYVNARLLDEEYRYVLDRKNKQGFIGNTLPRPQIVMKRLKVGDTSDLRNQALKGENFKKKLMATANRYVPLINKKQESEVDLELSSNYYDFLDTNAKWVCIKVEENQAEVPVSKEFGIVMLLGSNGSHCASRSFTVQNNPQVRDLRSKTVFNGENAYIEKNQSLAMPQGHEFTMNDCENNFELIDSIEKLYNLQNEISKIADFSDWRFLTHWDKLSDQEKEEKYFKFMSHELNFFIYQKDPFYFESKILPFLKCKLQKTLVDKFLLSESLEEYVSDWPILNIFEKVLLIKWLSSSGNPRSEFLVKSIRDMVEPHKKSMAERDLLFRKIFQMSQVSPHTPMIPPGFAPPPPPPPGMFFDKPTESGFRCMPMMMMDSAPAPRTMALSINNEMKKSSARFATLTSAVNQSEMIQAKSIEKFGGIFGGKKELDDFDDPDHEIIKQLLERPAYYKQMDTTKEYIETNYFNHKTPNSSPQISASLFWAELAESFSKSPSFFLSESVIYSTSSVSERIFILAFTSLPFESAPHIYESRGKSIKITASSPLLLFYKELAPVQAEISSELLAAHRYFKPSQRFIISKSGQKIESVLQRLVKNTLYEGNLVISNISGQHKTLNILQVVPEGSIPISPPVFTKNHIIELSAYTTRLITYTFYFPEPGNFSFFPANIAEGQNVIAIANTPNLEVLHSEVIETFETFNDILLSGNNQKIIEYLLRENPYSQDFVPSKILFKLKDFEFYKQVIDIFKNREYFNAEIFSYSFYHKDIETAKIFIQNHPNMRENLKYFENKLLRRQSFPHYEYSPLVNSRVYQLGNKEKVPIKRMNETYSEFLLSLAEKESLDFRDKLRFCQYYIYRDNQMAATTLFYELLASGLKISEEKPGTTETQIQIDYLGAYLSPEIASTVAVLYENYPIKHWKKLFSEVSQVIKESQVLDSQDPEIILKEEPSFTFKIEDGVIFLNHSNINSCKIRIYLIDLEILFSKSPFLQSNCKNFSFAKPSEEFDAHISGTGSAEINLPENYLKKNVIVEVDCEVYVRSLTYYANELKVNTLGMQGILKISDRKSIPKAGVYIKVFARFKDQTIGFYKDGFTDIRGKFDYVSLNGNSFENVEKFAILASDPVLGSLIIESSPPSQ